MSAKQPTIKKTVASQQPKKSEHKRRTSDEVWDALFEKPESEALLTLLIAEARKDRQEGKMLDGDWE